MLHQTIDPGFSMLQHLPAPVLGYFASVAAQDVDAIVSLFTHDAVVQDEGETHVGTDAIRAWALRTTQRYQPRTEVDSFEGDPGEVRVWGTVSGTFAGSPAPIRYTFRLRGAHIVWWSASSPSAPRHRIDPDELRGRRALVTGGTRGIGAAIARRLRDAGARVLVTARSDRDAADGVETITADLADRAGVAKVVAEVEALAGGIDILVHNVGGSQAPAGGSRP